MNRRTLLKSLFAASLVPVVALGKVKPKFPRFFVLVEPTPRCRQGVYTMFGPDCVYSCWRISELHRKPRSLPLNVAYDWTPSNPNCRRAAIRDVKIWVQRGYWREITAAEAEALLKPKPLAGACPACGKRGLFLPCQGYFSPPVSCTECGTIFPVESPTEWSR